MWLLCLMRNEAFLMLKEAQFSLPLPRRSKPTAPTIAPASSDTSCFVDAAWSASSLSCGMGWCLMDPHKNLLQQGSESQRFVSSALAAETLALKTAWIAASHEGYRSIDVYSDSQSLVTLLRSNGVVNELKNLLLDIRGLVEDFHSICFHFIIPRTANVLADALAKSALVALNSSSVLGA